LGAIQSGELEVTLVLAVTIDVKVTTNAGTSSTGTADQFTYVAAAVPAITSVAPTSVYTTGGASVTIVGSAFTGATGVKFGTTAVTSFTVYNDQTIVAIAPVHSSGTVDITVTTFSGTSSTSAADQTTYVIPPPSITGLTPNYGPFTGRNTVIISGVAFTGVTSVKFGSNSATIQTSSDTSITVNAPAGTLGTTVDVTVTTSYGTSAIVFADQYTYVQASAPVGGGASPLLLQSASTGGTNGSTTRGLSTRDSQNGTATGALGLPNGSFLNSFIITGQERIFSEKTGLWDRRPAEVLEELRGSEGDWLHGRLVVDYSALPHDLLGTLPESIYDPHGISFQLRELAFRNKLSPLPVNSKLHDFETDLSAP
jgi:hypothetical protein